jgi:hypothetical protein
MKIHFKEVGRDKRSWTQDFSNTATEDEIAKAAKRGAGLMSSCVDAAIYEQGDGGEIVVGGFRTVGTFTISNR